METAPKRLFCPKKKFDSITSYGLILFYRDPLNPTNISILLHQRRDTFEYVDFILGSWNAEKPLSSFFKAMTIEERDRIRDYTFGELWDDIWIDKTLRQYKDNYPRAQKRYNDVKHLIANILTETTSNITEPPWGFPKGRKDLNEDDLQCAIRETEEETRIPREKYYVLHGNNHKSIANKIPIDPSIACLNDILGKISTKFSERFEGTNGLFYVTIYYLAEVKDLELPDPINTPLCIRKTSYSHEAKTVKWVNYKDVNKYLCGRRVLMLQEVYKMIEEYYS